MNTLLLLSTANNIFFTVIKMTNKSLGTEQFEHLFDKSNLLLFMLNDEKKEIDELRSSVRELKRERDTHREKNRELRERVEQLSEKRSEIDVKSGAILKALKEAHLQ
ncbi:MAG: hypothetical protein HKN33_16575 [Pyrinomonadaceae bacterium]|nr:hypothetical protein [Pyrinomonadaceae bacterium]